MAAAARLKIAVTIAMLAIGTLTGSSASFAQTHRFSGFLPSVVNIYVLEISGDGNISASSGSGSVISNKGYIATNNHVIQVGEGENEHRASDVRVFFPGEATPQRPCSVRRCGAAKARQGLLDYIAQYKKGLKATIEFSDANRDLAVIKTDTPIVNPAVTLTTVEPEASDPVFAVGYPGAAQTFASATASPTITNGMVGRSYTADNSGSQIKLIQHNAAINGGNSGGPLIDQCERVVGVNTWGAGDSQGIFYSTASTELIALLKQHNIPFNVSTSSCSDTFGLSSAFNIPAKYHKPILYGLGAALLVFVFTMLQRRPRKAVLDAASRSVNAVSRRLKSNDQPARKEAQQFIRFLGYGSAESFSCKIPMETLSRAPNGIVIGRSPESATFTISNGNVSRRHALLTLRDGHVSLEDLGSTNGTKVNDKALEPNVKCRLREGDKVSFGNLKFEVRL